MLISWVAEERDQQAKTSHFNGVGGGIGYRHGDQADGDASLRYQHPTTPVAKTLT
jgi:hypothetical protein